MKLVSYNDLVEESKYLRLLVYGEPGTGKTWFAASGCLDEVSSPTLFVEYKAQVGSLRSNPQYRKALEEGRLIIVSLERYKELSAVFTWLKRGRGSYSAFDDLMEGYGYGEDEMPKVVAIDSLTELQRLEVMRRAGNDTSRFLTDVDAPEIRDWGSLLNQFTLLANKFFGLPYHVIFSGLETVDYGKSPVGEAPPIEGYRVALQGQAKRQFPAYAYTLMRLENAPRGSKAFCVGYTRGAKMRTKEQTGFLPKKIPDPTVPMLVKMLQADESPKE